MTSLKVATWNMDIWKKATFGKDPAHHGKAWAYLAGLGCDIALVQEATSPLARGDAGWSGRTVPSADTPESWWIGPRRRWGSAVVVFNPALTLEAVPLVPLGQPRNDSSLAASHPGTFAVAKVGLPDGLAIVVASVYALIDDYNPEIGEGYSSTTINRTLSDLTPLADSMRGQRMLFGGDFNGNDQWRPGTRSARWGPLHSATMTRIAALGFRECLSDQVPAERGPLEDCPCGPRPDCRHVRTFRQGYLPTSTPGHFDDIFVKPALHAQLTSCRALDEEEAWALSDHCPVVATFEV